MPEQIAFTIEGMSCQHCVRAVQAALEAVPGASVREVVVGSARVEYDGQAATADALADAIADAGYAPTRVPASA